MLIVAIPKEGDLSVCDNWRGINLCNGKGVCKQWQRENCLSHSVVSAKDMGALTWSTMQDS